MALSTERGGPTTQAGIYFQNCVAALKLAQMLSGETLEKPFLGKIVSVRIEAPEEVDDTIVTYEGKQREHIQSKTAIAINSEAWKALWQHFHKQYTRDSFNKSEDGDWMTIAVRADSQLNDLEILLTRAHSSNSEEEWRDIRLTKPQQKLLENIKAILGIEYDGLLRLCKRVVLWKLNIENDPMGMDSFEKEVSRILYKTVAPLNGVFPRLIDLIAKSARNRGTFTYEDVRAQLEEHGFKVQSKLPQWDGVISAEQTLLMRNIEESKKSLETKTELLTEVRRDWEVETDRPQKRKLQKQLDDLDREAKELAQEVDKLIDELRAKNKGP